ncbi:glycosyltransferase [Vibrio tubiashii]|uniref:glycosyltransferase family 2 protein n=1 Tax=Vibrio tubiashii TaxID=29498 RepID=UPI0009005BAC|nr:glycosyltransferase family 2 protein [Vibrio tubiashii]
MKVSVCIATYNGGEYLVEQLNSIFPQLGTEDEIIISDDYSTDNTLEIVKELNDPRVKIYLNSLGKGYTRNFENALSQCTGDIIFLCDQDDVWEPNKVQRMSYLLSKNDLVVSDCKVVNDKLETIYNSHFSIHRTSSGFLKNFIKPRYIGACMAFNRRVLDCSLPFPKKQKYCAHDYWISLVAEMKFNVATLDEPLMLYRRHAHNASSGGEVSKFSLSHKVSTRVYTGICLLLRWIR